MRGPCVRAGGGEDALRGARGWGRGQQRGDKAAYRRLAREVHPDAAGGCGAGEDFVRLHAAYATLADPDERARYDRSTVARPAAVRTRTWETDQCW